MRQWDTENTK